MRELSFDPYATLGIPPRADTRQVRDAYHRLARQHHPDRSDDRRANERMQCINRAWAILSSPARRARARRRIPRRTDGEPRPLGGRTSAGVPVATSAKSVVGCPGPYAGPPHVVSGVW